MGRVLLGAGLTAVFLVTQGILILRTRSLRGLGAYFGTPPRTDCKPPRSIVLCNASFFIAPGVAVLALIVRVGLKSGLTLSEAAQRLWAVNVNLLMAVLFLVPGVYALIQPSGMLGWARTTHPEIPENYPFGLFIVRLIGAGFCLMALFVLFALVS